MGECGAVEAGRWSFSFQMISVAWVLILVMGLTRHGRVHRCAGQQVVLDLPAQLLSG